MPTPTPVLLDTDIGTNVDDLLALLLVATAPELTLAGVTTVYGDTRLRAQVALRVLRLLGQDHVPVGPGVGDPRSCRQVYWPGHEGRGYGELPALPQDAPSAREVFCSALDRYGADLTVVAIGPLTNVAGYLELAAARGQRLRRLVVMGGQFGEGPPDRNIASDAAAAQAVAAANVDTVYVPINICRQVRMTAGDFNCASIGTELGGVIRTQVDTWLAYLDARHLNPCDPLTALYLLAPEVFDIATALVDFTDEGATLVAPDGHAAIGSRYVASVRAGTAVAEIRRRLETAVVAAEGPTPAAS